MMEFRSGNLLFTSKFDSGNLANVERVNKDEDEEGGGGSNSYTFVPGIDLKPDYEYNVWTNPDCAGTEYENGNRSWFYFGIRGWAPNRLIKINIINLNRQGRLYSQGHTPLVRTVPGKPKWERLRERPTFENVDGQFNLSFMYRFPEFKGATTYFAFCFPWSYIESQNQMSELDNRFEKCKTFNTSTPVNSIYYHRELMCLTLDKLRVDLLTISSCHGITNDNEPRFDKHLFPDTRHPRCKRFKGKKVYFLSSRVHPGETPASFVYNGFLEFILREKDPRAIQLRKQYVFKLIPMLNPDGVMRGHYRTDARGVNLNRVYLDPNPALHPTIYAAKSLLVYHHIYNRNIKDGETESFHIGFPTSENLEFSPQSTSRTVVPNSASCDDVTDTEREKEANAVIIKSSHCHSNKVDNSDGLNFNTIIQKPNHKIVLLKHQVVEPLNLADLDSTDTSVSDSGLAPEIFNPTSQVSSSCTSVLSNFEQTKGEGRKVNSELRLQLSELTMSEDYGRDSAFNDKFSDSDPNLETEHLGNEGSDNEGDYVPSGNINVPHLVNPKLLTILPSDSGIAFYVDLHGHASKRGVFIYGNNLENEDMQVENMLFTKLISLNTAHFDFGGCNFSERNMYSKDKRDGMSKEGSGRVSTLKALGIIHSYTLECNYNMGRMVNPVPPAQNDEGRATPPPLAGFPPKYTQAHYEEIGKAIAIGALDMTDTNPWSRVAFSEHCSLHGVREWVRRYLRSIRGLPRGVKNSLSRTSNCNGNTSSNNQNNNRQIKGNPSENIVQSRRRLSSDTTLAPGNPARRMSTDSSNGKNVNNIRTQSIARKELAPVKETSRGNQSRRPEYIPSHNSSSAKTVSTSSAPVLAMTRGHVDDVTYHRHMSADENIRRTSEEKSYLKNNSLLNIASKKQGPPSKLPLPTGSVGVHFPPSLDLNTSGRFLNNAQYRRHDSGSRRLLEDTIFHNDSTLMASDNNLMSVRSGAPSSGHSGKRIAQSSGNSLHRGPMSSALSSTSSGLRTNSGTRMGVSSGNSVTRQPIRSTGDEDAISAGESPKRKKKFSYLKRKPGMQSPKAMYARGQDSSIYSNNDFDRKAKRTRRRKSQRKISFLSDEDSPQDVTVPSNSVAGNAVNLTPRHIINYSQPVTYPSPLPHQKLKTSSINPFKKLPSSTFDLSIWRRPTVTKKSVFWIDF